MKIILEGPEGKRTVEAGVRYRLLPGEKVIDSERGGKMAEDRKKLEVLAKKEGLGVGDLVVKLTKSFGIKPCAKCEQRRQVLNRLRMYGWKIGLDKVE